MPDEFDATVSRLATTEEQVEDLKLQLDAAMGAEDMLEQLTERNLTLNEVGLVILCRIDAHRRQTRKSRT